MRPIVRRPRLDTALLLAPGTVALLVLLVAPLGILVAYSFFIQEGFRSVWGPTLGNYVTALTDRTYDVVLGATLGVALIVAVLVVAIDYLLAYILVFIMPARREFVYFLILISLFGGYLVRIYAWRTILGADGIINSILLDVHLIHAPIRWLNNSRFAVTVVLVNFLLPLVLLPLFSAFQTLPKEFLEVARDLGAGWFRTFRTITFPLTRNGARAALAFGFIIAAGDYVTPSLVGGVNGIMTGNLIAQQFTIALDWPLGAALAIIVVVATLIVYSILARLLALAARV